MKTRITKRLQTLIKLTVVVFCITLIPAMKAFSSDTAKVLPQYVYLPSENPLLQAKTVLAKAKENNKYALIVLGAQWCHDSVGLAQRFSTDEMHTLLSERFETQFIDVGYLEDRRDITNLVGYPTYFATPTVLIVDPELNTVMNMDSLKIWQSADSVELSVYIEAFSAWNKNDNESKASTKSSSEVLAKFEQEQSERLQQAYTALSPLLAASDSDNEQSKEDRTLFLNLWKEAKMFRTTVQANIHQFRNTKLSEAELEETLLEVTLPKQSWE